jgi:hypothetical protein
MTYSTRRPPHFKISVPGNEERKSTILQKLPQVREILMHNLNHPVNNGDILEKYTNEECPRAEVVNEYLYPRRKKSVDEKIFSTAECSLLKVGDNHSENKDMLPASGSPAVWKNIFVVIIPIFN